MSIDAPTVCVVTNIVPHYRVGFYNTIVKRGIASLVICCQSSMPGINIESQVLSLDPSIEVFQIPFISARQERVAFQFLPRRAFEKDIDVHLMTANPRVVSTVFYSLFLEICGRPVIGWGQVNSGGAGRLSRRLKLAWWRRLSGLYVYTDEEADSIRREGYGGAVAGMNNGLDQDRIEEAASRWPASRLRDWQRPRGIDPAMTLVSCARLDPKNAFDLVVSAMEELRDRWPRLKWYVIGDGPERARIESIASNAGLSDRVEFVGSLYEEDDLAPWFLSATMMVHPGKIGLSLLHAFGYGCPVVTNGDVAFHTPEIAAFGHRRTGLFFERGDASSLAGVVEALLAAPQLRDTLGREARRVAREDYNVGVMVDRFRHLLSQMLSARRKTDRS